MALLQLINTYLSFVQVQMKETSDEQKATEERVYQDRQYQVPTFTYKLGLGYVI